MLVFGFKQPSQGLSYNSLSLEIMQPRKEQSAWCMVHGAKRITLQLSYSLFGFIGSIGSRKKGNPNEPIGLTKLR
jgi:hypothetical protein